MEDEDELQRIIIQTSCLHRELRRDSGSDKHNVHKVIVRTVIIDFDHGMTSQWPKNAPKLKILSFQK